MLEVLDLSRKLPRGDYARELARRQIQLRELGYQVYVQKRPVVIAFEGWDAAGKGGIIKRITERIDPRGYVVFPISAPNGEDKTRHYLYRFWRRLPETRPDRHLRPLLVWPRFSGARRRIREGGGMETRLQGDQCIRAPTP